MNGIKGLTVQNRLIIVGLISTTIVMLCATYFAVNKTKLEINNGYKNFGQVISNTLGVEAAQLTKDIPDSEKFEMLRSHCLTILNNNEDIAYIEFKDNNSKTIYSSKDDFTKRAETSKIVVSSPMTIKTDSSSQVIGTATVALSEEILNEVSNTISTSLIWLFALTWALIALVLLVHTILSKRELNMLQDGVKKISAGTFGIQVESIGMSKEVKKLLDDFNNMSVKLHQYDAQNLEQLMLEKDKLEAVLACIANGVIVCDNYDNVTLINEPAQKFLDVTEEEILTTKIDQYCDKNGELCFKDKIEEYKNSAQNEEQKPVDFQIEAGNCVLKSIISPMYTLNHEYVGYIIVLINMTKEAETDKLRSHFISNVSHELRTPVTVLRSYIDTLYNYGNDFDFETQKEFIGVMNQEIIRLNRMVNDILDFSRYESQNVNIEKETQDIMPVIEDVVDEMKLVAAEHNLSVSIMKESDLPQVPFNKESIRRVIANLVSNAIKYSPDNTKIKIKAETFGNYLQVSVEDQGQGIAEEYLSKIFDRFFRVENQTHTIKGTGLGLHLVKISIEKHHNGEVFVKSKLGEGSTFGFRLPINPQAISSQQKINSTNIES